MLRMLVLTAALLWSQQSAAQPLSLTQQSHGLVGEYYSTDTAGHNTVVLVLGGSEGGIPSKLAQPIAEKGWPTLALAYFKSPGLAPELEKIPVEYVEGAIDWLIQQSGETAERVVVVGWSKGAELALLLASGDPRIDAVAAIAPSSVVWAGILNDWTKVPASSWTRAGQPLPHVAFNPSGEVNGLRDLYEQSLDNRSDDDAASIKVESLSARVLLMSGEDDEIWPSSLMADQVCQRMATSANGHCQHERVKGETHLLHYRFLDPSDSLYNTLIAFVAGNNPKGGEAP